MRSGNVNPANTAGTFRNAGNNGNWWSSRAYSSATHAYNLNVYTEVNPSNNSNRYAGFSLRCLEFAAAGADLLPFAIDKFANLCYNEWIGGAHFYLETMLMCSQKEEK